jgi:hypothetical protein
MSQSGERVCLSLSLELESNPRKTVWSVGFKAMGQEQENAEDSHGSPSKTIEKNNVITQPSPQAI